jgi:hypothetical protein
VVLADAFNLFDRQSVLEYDNYVESPGFQVTNPDFGRPLVYSTRVRSASGARFEF